LKESQRIILGDRLIMMILLKLVIMANNGSREEDPWAMLHGSSPLDNSNHKDNPNHKAAHPVEADPIQ
jgi:hypothetical protein